MQRAAVLLGLLVLLCGIFATANPEDTPIAGLGGFPISKQMTSMWLAGSDKRPLLMVYFHGRDNWHNTDWKINTNFQKNPIWAEFKSSRQTLRLWVNTDSGQAQVQTTQVDLKTGNTFLVVHVGELTETVLPLGTFELLATKEHPAAVMLLRAHPELMQRINKLAAEN